MNPINLERGLSLIIEEINSSSNSKLEGLRMSTDHKLFMITGTYKERRESTSRSFTANYCPIEKTFTIDSGSKAKSIIEAQELLRRWAYSI